MPDPRGQSSDIILVCRMDNIGDDGSSVLAGAVLLAAPERCFVRRILACQTEAHSGAAAVDVITPLGTLADTVDIATGGAAGTVTSQEYSALESANFLEAGDLLRLNSDGVPSDTGAIVYWTIVLGIP